MANGKVFYGEPAIKDGDFIQRGGDWERVTALNNEILILVGTDAGYWGNLIEPNNSQVPGGLEEFKQKAITSNLLKSHSAKVESCLSTMIVNGDAKDISVESYNPEADRIEWIATIILSDDRKYIYDSYENEGSFE